MAEIGYFVTKREKCAECNGTGMVMHPMWKEFFRENPKPLSTEDEATWWTKRGYDIERRQASHFYQGLPPEEIDCRVCSGSGVLETPVELLQAIKEVDGQERMLELLERSLAEAKK